MSNEPQDNNAVRPASKGTASIATETDFFVKQIDGLADTLPLAMVSIKAALDNSRQDFDKFLKEECKATSLSDKTTYTIEPDKYLRFRRLSARAEKASLAYQNVPKSILVSLVSQFDAFLGRLIRQLFTIKPESLNSSGNTLTFSQLVEFDSISDAREYIIDKEIESVLRKSHAEQFDWLENKFGLPLRNDLGAWPSFIEVTERRNLYVHTNGVVSHQYLEVCRKHGCEVDSDTRIGQTISTTPQYFRNAHECIFEIGVKLAQVLWRKLRPDEIAKADASLIHVCYELLVEARYKLACVLLDFGAGTLKRHASEENRLTLVINRAQAYKWSGKEEEARKIMSAEDWTATREKFRLAQAVLSDDVQETVKIMKQIGTDEEVRKNEYREWPLFKEMRKRKEFASAFYDIFGEPLTIFMVSHDGREDAGPTARPN